MIQSLTMEMDALPEDSTTSRTIAGIFSCFSAVYLATLAVASIIRRNHQPLLSRSLILNLFSLCHAFLLLNAAALRIVIGRNIYPCPLYAINVYIALPCYLLSTNVRSFRLYFAYRLNRIKQTSAATDSVDSESDHNLEPAPAPSNSSSSLSAAALLGTKSRRAHAKRMRFLMSSTFLLIFQLSIMTLCTTAWLIDTLSRESYGSQACALGGWSAPQIFVGVFTSISVILGIFGAFLIRNIRASFGLTREVVASKIVIIVTLVLWLLATNLNVWIQNIEYNIVSSAIIIWIGASTDVMVCIGVPFLRTFQKRYAAVNESAYNESDFNNEISAETDKNNHQVHSQQHTCAHMRKAIDIPDMRRVFRQHCDREFSSENIIAWTEIENFVADSDPQSIETRFMHIVTNFIEQGAPAELNIATSTRDPIVAKYNTLISLQKSQPSANPIGANITLELQQSAIPNNDNNNNNNNNNSDSNNNSNSNSSGNEMDAAESARQRLEKAGIVRDDVFTPVLRELERSLFDTWSRFVQSKLYATAIRDGVNVV